MALYAVPNRRRLLAVVITMVLSSGALADTSKALGQAAQRAKIAPAVPLQLMLQREQQQLTRVREVVRGQDARLQKELDKMRQSQAMRAELKRIAAAKTAAQRRQLATLYQQKYRGTYETAMKRARVSQQNLLQQARRVSPDLNLRVVQGFSLQATPKRLSGLKRAQNAPPATTPLTSTTRITDFETRRDVTTGAGGFAVVNVEQTRVQASAAAILVGGVRAEGELTKRISIPEDAQEASIRVRGTATVDSVAVGVFGAASYRGAAGANMDKVGSDDDRKLFGFARSYIFAPFLWVATQLEEISIDRTFRVGAGERWDMLVMADSFAVAAASPETHGNARFDDLEVDLIVTR